MKNFLAPIIVTLCLSGCATKTPFTKKDIVSPGAWKAMSESRVLPYEKSVLSDKWWLLFGEDRLNALIEELLEHNLDLKSAAWHIDEAVASARLVSASYFPTLYLNPTAERFRRPGRNLGSFNTRGFTDNSYDFPFDVSYEFDAWGKIRNAVKAKRKDAAAVRSAYKTLKLTLAGDLAVNYFSLRSLDAEKIILEKTIKLRKDALALVENRQKQGLSNNLDIALAKTELGTAEAEALKIKRLRVKTENALAVLCGKNPSSFSIEVNPLGSSEPPAIPPSIPSKLLERRPDIAEAEYLLAKAYAEIGEARANFLPTVSLTALGGFGSTKSSTLFEDESRSWSVKPKVSLPMFTGGENMANLRLSKARYQKTLADFQKRVQLAFSETENALSAVQLLEKETEAYRRTVNAARLAAELSQNRYKEGLINFFEFIDAERSRLLAERQVVQNLNERFSSSVALIKALGGGWGSAEKD